VGIQSIIDADWSWGSRTHWRLVGARLACHSLRRAEVLRLGFAPATWRVPGAVLINSLGCLWYFTAAWEGLENSWIAHVGERPLSSELVAQCRAFLRRDLAALCGAHLE
jgi:hypothetical protein